MKIFEYQTEKIKQAIREGKVVWSERQTGKTTAIMEVVHDDYQGKALVFVPNELLRGIFRRAYRDKYHGEPVPVVTAAHSTEIIDRVCYG